MSESKPDVFAKQLKASLARRRWQPWKLVLATMVAGIVVMALLAWWLYPRPRLTPLQIIALDIVCIAGDTPSIRAQLLTPPDEKEPRGLSGHSIVFHEQRLMPKPNEKPREIVVKSDAQGQAAVDWPVEKDQISEFFVRYINPVEGPGSPNDRGSIFVWETNDPLLIVDADETLMANELDEKASEALTRAAKEGWKVVYLSLASKQPHEFRTARGWIGKQQPKLPAGPVLSRPQFTPEMTTAKARREVLQSLHSRFKGKMLAIVKNTEAAQISKDIGVQTILIGKERAPAEVVQAATWADVVVRLE